MINIGQIIILPKVSINHENLNLATKKVFYHQTSKPEYISNIAKIHKISIEEIKNLNNLNNALKINPNVKLKLRKSNLSKWLRYGSLMINWSDWTYINGNYMAMAKTKKNKPFYLALNCNKKALNNTVNNSYWTSWYFPETDFEFKLINDFCDKDLKV